MCIKCSFYIYICCFNTSFEQFLIMFINTTFFDFSRWILSAVFDLYKSSKFQLLVRFAGPICVIMPNDVQIGQTVAHISRFWDFSLCRPHRSWIFLKFQIFSSTNGQEGRPTSPCQISSKLLKKRPRYGDFSNFQIGCRL